MHRRNNVLLHIGDPRRAVAQSEGARPRDPGRLPLLQSARNDGHEVGSRLPLDDAHFTRQQDCMAELGSHGALLNP